jgi:hypothetical protein
VLPQQVQLGSSFNSTWLSMTAASGYLSEGSKLTFSLFFFFEFLCLSLSFRFSFEFALLLVFSDFGLNNLFLSTTSCPSITRILSASNLLHSFNSFYRCFFSNKFYY